MRQLSPEAYAAIVQRLIVFGLFLAVCLAVALIAGRGHVAALVARARGRWREWKRAPGRDGWMLAALTVAGALIRLRYLAQPVRTDEAATFLYYVFQPLLVGISVYGSPNNHLLNTLLSHGIFAAFGDVPALLRLPSFLAGVLTIPASYLAARSLISRQTAMVTAALVAGLPVLIDFSALSRGYSMIALSLVLALLCASEALRTQSRLYWAWSGAMLAIGLYAIPVMLYGAAFLYAWVALEIVRGREDRRARWGGLVISALTMATLSAILYGPVLIISGPGSIISNSYIHAQGRRSWLSDPEDGFRAIWQFFNEGLPHWVWWCAALLGIYGMIRDRRYLIVGIVPLFVGAMVLPYHRTWLMFVPLWLMFLANGITSLIRAADARWVAAVLAAALITGTLYTNAPYFSKETGSFRAAESLSGCFSGRLRAGDAIIAAVPMDLPLMYYFARRGMPTEVFSDRPGSGRTFIVTDRIAGGGLAPGIRARAVCSRSTATVYELER
jgi:Dolichyl-phosphate-mannose-protein mannosyltransferase